MSVVRKETLPALLCKPQTMHFNFIFFTFSKCVGRAVSVKTQLARFPFEIAVRQVKKRQTHFAKRKPIDPFWKQTPRTPFFWFDCTDSQADYEFILRKISNNICELLSSLILNWGLEGKHFSQLLDLIKQILCWINPVTFCSWLKRIWVVTEYSPRNNKEV